ncbi:MAG TPA: hypothetical protein PK794_09240 [Armatimonadota bacterium]|nr:hypothetical protein [Armatimonadota bacterium]
MMVLTVFSLIIIVVVTVFITSMRVWRRTASQQQAFPPAFLIMDRLSRELKNAYAIAIGADGDSLTFRLPALDDDGVNRLDASGRHIFGREIRYYLVADAADEEAPRELWRDETVAGGGTVSRRLAENVVDMTFEVDSSSERVFAVYSTAITLLGQEGAQTYESRFNGAVAFRNQTSQP